MNKGHEEVCLGDAGKPHESLRDRPDDEAIERLCEAAKEGDLDAVLTLSLVMSGIDRQAATGLTNIAWKMAFEGPEDSDDELAAFRKCRAMLAFTVNNPGLSGSEVVGNLEQLSRCGFPSVEETAKEALRPFLSERGESEKFGRAVRWWRKLWAAGPIRYLPLSDPEIEEFALEKDAAIDFACFDDARPWKGSIVVRVCNELREDGLVPMEYIRRVRGCDRALDDAEYEDVWRRFSMPQWFLSGKYCDMVEAARKLHGWEPPYPCVYEAMSEVESRQRCPEAPSAASQPAADDDVEEER